MDYLLTSSAFLLKNDLNGWLKTFKPSCLQTQTSSPTVSLKRKRGAETSPGFNSTPQETKCEECKGQTIEDVMEGHVVCLKCGLIQARPIYVPDAKVLFFSRLSLVVTTAISIPVSIVATIHTFAQIVGAILVFSSKTGRPEWISRMARNRKRRPPVLSAGVLPKPVDGTAGRNDSDDRGSRDGHSSRVDRGKRDASRERAGSRESSHRRHQGDRATQASHAPRSSHCRERIRKKLKLGRPERRPYVEV